MAQIKQLLTQVTITARILHPKIFSIVPSRNSQYGPQFVDPLFRKEDIIKAKETGEAKKLVHLPIKAPKNEESSSKFYDARLEKFVNYVMRKGKKELARMLVYKALEQVKRIQIEKYHRETDTEIKENLILDPLQVFYKAVDNCKPLLQLMPVKKGGATYQVPVPVTPFKANFLAMNWLIEAGKSEPRDVRFYTKLANELVLASKGKGKVVKKKEDLYKQCEANKAYAHYRWS